MDISGRKAASLNVEEAMKILNMKKFDAEELNEKFRYRIASVARGLGGSLETQRKIYTAWEYLNRMLARQASANTEEILRKADKKWKIFDNPKQLDMIPLRFNASRKASLIIEKKDQTVRPEKKTVGPTPHANSTTSGSRPPTRILAHNPPPLHETASAVQNLPGRLYQKHVKWNQQENKRGATESSANKRMREGSKSSANQRKIQESLPDSAMGFQNSQVMHNLQKHSEEDSLTTHLREIAEISRKSREHPKSEEDAEKLGRILKKLPKLSQTTSRASLFKTTALLNEIFENSKKPNRFDQRSSARRVLWKERAKRFLNDNGDLGNDPLKSQAKTKRTSRKVSKKQQQVLYQGADIPGGLGREIKISSLPTMAVPPAGALKQTSPAGMYTPTRIMNWIQTVQNK